jgi:hypothetical protein
VLLLSGLLLVSVSGPASAEELNDRVAKLESQVDKMTKGPGIAVGDWRFLPYGYIKVDAAYDSARAFNGDFYAWTLQETKTPTNLATQARPDDHAFSLTANQSRFDMKVIAPKYGDIETYGLFEIDLYGNLINSVFGSATGGPENKPAILLRHAFIEMKSGTWGLLAGQTSDPISLQVEDTWNYFVGWMAGNPGYRRPQVRIMKDLPLGEKSKISLWTGIMRTVENTGFVQAGEESGFPTTFARVTYTAPMLGKELLISVNGHYGREDAQNATVSGATITPGTTIQGPGGSRNIKSYSGNVEFIVPLPVGFWVKGEAYLGSVMGSYFGAIGQSFNTTTLQGIHAYGGWAQLGWIANDRLRFHVGGSVDDVLKSDLATNGRALNRAFYANFMYNITPAVLTGYEITDGLTQYKNGPNGIDVRHQISLMYKF